MNDAENLRAARRRASWLPVMCMVVYEGCEDAGTAQCISRLSSDHCERSALLGSLAACIGRHAASPHRIREHHPCLPGCPAGRYTLLHLLC